MKQRIMAVCLSVGLLLGGGAAAAAATPATSSNAPSSGDFEIITPFALFESSAKWCSDRGHTSGIFGTLVSMADGARIINCGSSTRGGQMAYTNQQGVRTWGTCYSIPSKQNRYVDGIFLKTVDPNNARGCNIM